MEKRKSNSALRTSLIAVLTAVVVVFTILVKIPTPTKGYLNLCDLAICFIAFTFSPLTALIAGGLGTAIADIISGYPQWAPISFVVHGLEGLVVALIVKRSSQDISNLVKVSTIKVILAMVACVIIVAGGYFVLSAIFMSLGFAAAAAGIPGNIGQSGIGVIAGYALSRAVIKAYPPVQGLLNY
ncbi:MAG: ECF transporter S component [Sphaerochaetaceae bacterium]|nr:ECF transporter S component [Sphaerochaetaceae bacterium]MDC7248319.1 ECF transporter S component [Sphaerochaetaceae bacterium]